MSTSDLLASEAQRFAGGLNDLLRRTIRADAELEVRLDRDALQALIGFGVSEGLKLGTVPVRISDHGDAHLLISFDLTFDDERRYLAVRKSTVGLYLLTEKREPLFRYEFDRDKNRFAQAHLHVSGQSHALGRLYALAGKSSTAELHRLHLPVGGKRFRPSLEDVLECLFNEQLLQPLQVGVKRSTSTALTIIVFSSGRRYGGIPTSLLRRFESSGCSSRPTAMPVAAEWPLGGCAVPRASPLLIMILTCARLLAHTPSEHVCPGQAR